MLKSRSLEGCRLHASEGEEAKRGEQRGDKCLDPRNVGCPGNLWNEALTLTCIGVADVKRREREETGVAGGVWKQSGGLEMRGQDSNREGREAALGGRWHLAVSGEEGQWRRHKVNLQSDKAHPSIRIGQNRTDRNKSNSF